VLDTASRISVARFVWVSGSTIVLIVVSMQLLDPLRDVLRKLERHETPHFSSDTDKVYVRDSQDQVTRMRQQLKRLRSLIDGAFRTYAVKVCSLGFCLAACFLTVPVCRWMWNWERCLVD
jgi:hypothetical protein